MSKQQILSLAKTAGETGDFVGLARVVAAGARLATFEEIMSAYRAGESARKLGF